jgi:FtsH-binding integral membrane protein
MSDPSTAYTDYDEQTRHYNSRHQTAISGAPIPPNYNETVVIPVAPRQHNYDYPTATGNPVHPGIIPTAATVAPFRVPAPASPPQAVPVHTPAISASSNPATHQQAAYARAAYGTNNNNTNNNNTQTKTQNPTHSHDTMFWKQQNNLGTQLNRSPQFNRSIYNEFAPPSTRQSCAKFIHETLNYVFCQLCVTVAVVAGMYTHKTTVTAYLISNPTLMWIPIFATFATLIALFCCVSKSSTTTRQTLFWLFTISCSAMVGMSTIQYAPNVVLNASVTLLVIVGFLNIWAYKMDQYNTDISYLGPALMSALIITITISILNTFIQSTFIENCIAVVSVIVFSLLLIYDLNRLYNGAEEAEYADPLMAAINIYLDIINLFLNLLRLFGNNSD